MKEALMRIVYGGGSFTPEELVKFLMIAGQADSIFYEIIKYKEVLKKGREMKIDITIPKLQEFADNYRKALGLFSAHETFEFLNSMCLTEEDFEIFCEYSLLVNAVKDLLSDDDEIEGYFYNNRSDFDTTRISVIVVENENLANELNMQILEDGEDFYSLAREHSVDETTKHSGGYVGKVTRTMLPTVIASKVFIANAGDLLGPFQIEGVWHLILVEEVIKAILDDDAKEQIKEIMFQEWLSQFVKDGFTISLD
jgi:peptidylprolyl isomerase